MRRLHRPAYLLGAVYLLILCAAFAAEHSNRTQSVITVTTAADNGTGSLRSALAAANDGDTIQFDPALNGQSINLNSGELSINKNITISGPGPSLLTVSRNSLASFRVFHLQAGHTVTITGLTIRNGTTNGSNIFNDQSNLTLDNCIIRDGNTGGGLGQGGGISNSGNPGNAILAITNSVVTNNFATGYGGGIYTDGNASLTLTNSSITNNGAFDSTQQYGAGGGIYSPSSTSSVTVSSSVVSNNYAAISSGPPNPIGYGGGIVALGPLTISNSTISNNTAGINGGGIITWGNGTITNSTISNNAANGTIPDQTWLTSAGGIQNVGTLFISNSTISGNSAYREGGAIFNEATSMVANSTFSGNSAVDSAGGIFNANGATFQLHNTILRTGTSGSNIYNDGGTIISQGYNLSNDNGAGFLTATGDQSNANPLWVLSKIMAVPHLPTPCFLGAQPSTQAIRISPRRLQQISAAFLG